MINNKLSCPFMLSIDLEKKTLPCVSSVNFLGSVIQLQLQPEDEEVHLQSVR